MCRCLFATEYSSFDTLAQELMELFLCRLDLLLAAILMNCLLAGSMFMLLHPLQLSWLETCNWLSPHSQGFLFMQIQFELSAPIA